MPERKTRANRYRVFSLYTISAICLIALRPFRRSRAEQRVCRARVHVRSCNENCISEYYVRLPLSLCNACFKRLLLRAAKVAILFPRWVWRFSLLRHGQFVNSGTKAHTLSRWAWENIFYAVQQKRSKFKSSIDVHLPFIMIQS